MIAEICARCHTGDGPGTPHLRVDTAADVVAAADDIALAVAARVMPPWPASSESIEFQHNWSLDAAEIDAIVRWHRAGDPLDVDPTTTIAPAMGTVALADADVELVSASAYDGEAGQPDMYRCIVYDPALTERAYIEAVEFAPDQTTVVHHAIGFTLPEILTGTRPTSSTTGTTAPAGRASAARGSRRRSGSWRGLRDRCSPTTARVRASPWTPATSS